MADRSSTALQVQPTNYLTIIDDADAQAAIRDNLGGLALTPFKLPRVRVPAGGSTNWQVMSLDGATSVQALQGVIIYSTPWRAFYEEEFSGGGSPPDCQSKDGVTGDGRPGGECARCPLNQWGSGKNDGKACNELRALFLLQDGDVFPTLLLAPPTSVGAMLNYFINLANKRASYWKVETRVELRQAKSKSGFTYGELVPSLVRTLSPEEVAGVSRYRESIIPLLEAQAIDYNEGDDLPME